MTDQELIERVKMHCDSGTVTTLGFNLYPHPDDEIHINDLKRLAINYESLLEAAKRCLPLIGTEPDVSNAVYVAQQQSFLKEAIGRAEG